MLLHPHGELFAVTLTVTAETRGLGSPMAMSGCTPHYSSSSHHDVIPVSLIGAPLIIKGGR